MANQEHLEILKKGVKTWNEWRKKSPKIRPDLSHADLSDTDLQEANLEYANFSGSNCEGANFSGANLTKSNFNSQLGFKRPTSISLPPPYDEDHLQGMEQEESITNLSNAKFRGAKLTEASFQHTNLKTADFSRASLDETNLKGANLSNANLREASLYKTNLRGTKLLGVDFTASRLSYIEIIDVSLDFANFEGVWLSSVYFLDVDLSQVKGLDAAYHVNQPSYLGVESIYRSKGKIPEKFLRNMGVAGPFLTSIRSLIKKPIDFYSCFISYSSKDQAFADRLYADILNKGVRCWFAPHDMHIGDKIRPRIDESIRFHDKLLLILSEHSVASQWVEHEVETALGKELEGKPNVLFPIRLDDKVMESKTGWASHIRLTRYIGDFTNWKSHDEYQQAFTRLLRDLKAES